MASKNFLDQFSTNNKPDSFKEEVLVPSSKPKKPLNITLIVIIVIVILLGGFLTWFFVLRPTIEVPSFIGQEVSDVNSWLKQQGIQSSGVVFKDEYSEEYDEKIVIDQSIKEGKKVKKDVKIDFTVSKGPDPNVEVKVPDIISMNLREIESWIDTNKLSGIKITYEFSDEDPLDSVISYEFGSNASETNFKRSSSLTIVVSKGKQEDQPISVPNFVGKNVSEVTNWGSKNKIKIKQQEGYSSTVNKDMVISQSVNPGKKITAKEYLTVTISKGAPIIAPDFSSYSEANITAWGTKNNVNIEIIRKYSNDVEKNKVVSQSIKNAACNDGMSVTISLGKISLDGFTGTTLNDLNKWVEQVNKDGAGLSVEVDQNKVNSDTVAVNGLFNLKLDGSIIRGNISKGRNILLDNTTEKITIHYYTDNQDTPDVDESLSGGYDAITNSPINWENANEYKEYQIRLLCEANDGLVCNFAYEKGAGEIGKVIRIKRSDRDVYGVQSGEYISQDQYIEIIINEGQ